MGTSLFLTLSYRVWFQSLSVYMINIAAKMYKNRPDDHLEGWKATEREKSRLAIVEQIKIKEAQKLQDSIKRLADLLLHKK